jgi:hypothetical protein
VIDEEDLVVVLLDANAMRIHTLPLFAATALMLAVASPAIAGFRYNGADADGLVVSGRPGGGGWIGNGPDADGLVAGFRFNGSDADGLVAGRRPGGNGPYIGNGPDADGLAYPASTGPLSRRDRGPGGSGGFIGNGPDADGLVAKLGLNGPDADGLAVS